jgi:hypothetical protein
MQWLVKVHFKSQNISRSFSRLSKFGQNMQALSELFLGYPRIWSPNIRRRKNVSMSRIQLAAGYAVMPVDTQITFLLARDNLEKGRYVYQ